jgi:hypothetical protein
MDRKQKNLDNIFGKRKDGNITCKWKTTKDVVWDKIKSIKEVTPMKDGWVYDVTVEETRNFMSLNMLGVKDTFHQDVISVLITLDDQVLGELLCLLVLDLLLQIGNDLIGQTLEESIGNRIDGRSHCN